MNLQNFLPSPPMYTVMCTVHFPQEIWVISNPPPSWEWGFLACTPLLWEAWEPDAYSCHLLMYCGAKALHEAAYAHPWWISTCCP